MIGYGCMIGPPAATGKGVQIIGRIPIIGERKADVTDGLIHRWPLTANANDVVGALTLSNIGSVTFPDGASFNGSSQALYAGAMTLPTVFTVTGWIKYSTAHAASAFGMSNASGGFGSSVVTLADFNLSIYGGTYKINSGQNLADSKWHFVAFSGGASGAHTWQLYVDGMSEGSQSVDFTCDGNFAVGRAGAYTGGYWFSGSVKDCRFYSQALTADQHATLYSNGPNP